MKLNRRYFLSGLAGGTFLSPFTVRSIVGGIVTGMVDKVIANEQGQVPINYACLWIGGGIERWHFDGAHMPMGPDESQRIGLRHNYIKSRQMINGKNLISELGYKLTNDKVNGKFYLPYLWESKLPALSGSNISMKELAKHMITIRGVDTGTGIPDHEGNTRASEKPFGYEYSTTGLAAMNTNYTIPFGHNDGNGPKTGDKYGLSIDVSSIKETLSHFEGSSGAFFKKNKVAPNEIRALIDEFTNKITRNYTGSKKQAVSNLMKDRKMALDLVNFVMFSLDEIENFYLESFVTYQQVLARIGFNHEEGRQLKDFDDELVSKPGTSGVEEEMLKTYDTWTATPFDKWKKNSDGEFDFRESFKTLNFDSMAQTFATIETYFKYNLTNSLKLSAGQMRGDLASGWDVHFTGDSIRFFKHGKYYQALAAAMLVFLERSKNITDTEGQKISDRTMLHLRSEFDRSPAINGSNHFTSGCHESFFSNMIDSGPHIIGNINSNNDGVALEYTNGHPLSYKHIYSSLQNIYGHTPDRNFKPLLARSGSRIKPLTDECKNIKKQG